MSKSILVIDTPENCKECRVKCPKIKNKKCPLKKLPQKQIETYKIIRYRDGIHDVYGERKDSVAVGWNKCIDEILKEG